MVTSATKCPEKRKPHENSCTEYYRCADFADGGYVWLLFKCDEGLVSLFDFFPNGFTLLKILLLYRYGTFHLKIFKKFLLNTRYSSIV